MNFGEEHNYFRGLVEQGQVRPPVRAIIVNNPRGRFLVEKNQGALQDSGLIVNKGIYGL